MQDHSTAASKILIVTSYELKLLLRGILFPACLIAFFTYVIISLIDVKRSGSFNTIPDSVALIVGTIIVLKLLLYTRLEKTEIHRFRLIFLTVISWLIGNLIYVYYQSFVGIAVPYPSIADLGYLSATVFLSFHLFSILRLKRNIKANWYVYLGFVASIFPIYLLVDAIYNYEHYYPNSPMAFVVDMAYYIGDAVLIFPCIPIILYTPKNDPFIFHWLLIALSVFVIVTTDLGYVFLSSINEELLKNTEWLWSFFYCIGYILLTVSIMWFSKLKQILEYKQFSESLRNEEERALDRSSSANDFVIESENSEEILRAMKNITEKAEKQIDILFAQYIISKKEIIKFINILVELTRKNKSLNIRILLPSPKFKEIESMFDTISSMSIKYFDSPLNSNEIVSILDGDHLYILGLESENTSHQNRLLMHYANSESKIQVYSVLFERMWLMEKSLDFGQISK